MATSAMRLLIFCSANALLADGTGHSNSTCGLGLLQKGPSALHRISLLNVGESDEFSPVDGGIDRVCRGASSADNDPQHYSVVTTADLEQCKAECVGTTGCKGIEFKDTRCEIWTRPEGIQATVSVTGYTCLRYDGSPGSVDFSPVDGAIDRVCRGADASDNNPMHFTMLAGYFSLEACKQNCRQTAGCVGIESHSGGRCEVWTRPEGIGASKPASGYNCYRYEGESTTEPPSTTRTTTVIRSAEQDAQFLIQASFGPTRASLQALNRMSYEQWVLEQISLPASSHREYYRKRVSPRPGPKSSEEMESGSPRSRCKPGSRWVNHAILTSDENLPIKISANKIYVDGFFRSDVDGAYAGNGLKEPVKCSDVAPDSWQNSGYTCQFYASRMSWDCHFSETWTEEQLCRQTCFNEGYGYSGDDCSAGWVALNFEGYICDVKADAVGATVRLSTSSSCNAPFTTLLNPAVWNADPPANVLQALQFSVLRPGVLLLLASPQKCDLGTIVHSDSEGEAKFYALEKRLELVENTLEKPASSGSWMGGQCPTVPRSFLNEKTCRLLPGCMPVGKQKLRVELNTSTLAKFFNVGGRYVYAATKLRTSTSPCGTASRWQELNCATATCSASQLSTAEADAVKQGLDAAAAQGWLRDVDLECADVPAGTVIELNSKFYQHVHQDEYNVYDFTDWVEQHPGGASKITQWKDKGFLLEFPSWHSMERWESGLATDVIRPGYVGKLGSAVEFQMMPQPLQTEALATALGAEMTGEDFAEVCGSPGEVANDPTLGHQLLFKHGGTDDWNFDSSYETTWGVDRWGRSAIWIMQGMYAEDQLRQRVAWALSQIFVCSTTGAGHGDKTELWLNYYDIFVRNALGNFRDVLREVTYSPVMGDYLTYRRNRAYDHSNYFPDENYAREVMQLFTIGLWKLNPDGSKALDSNGEGIPTFTNEHIMNFARVFTGFDEQVRRSNVEDTGSGNKIDPMTMKVDWHDKYPKPDLDGNFLGDLYPLCDDLPSGAFLSQGAQYRFLGHSVDSEIGVLHLRSSSALHLALCGSSGPCRYSLTVKLPATLPCDGNECSTNTLKIVNVSGALYEYLPPPCVDLFFFTGQVTRWGGRAFSWRKECRDPKTLVAGTACCAGCKNRTTGWMDRNGITCENANTTWKGMFTQYCSNPDSSSDWFRDGKYCELACWENGVGYSEGCSQGAWRGERVCSYDMERVSLATAAARCADRGLELCAEKLEDYGCEYNDMEVWTPETCAYEVIVHPDGMVSSNWTAKTRQNRFSVPWRGNFPVVTSGQCPDGCVASGDSCSCAMEVETRQLFSQTPSKADLLQSAKIGSMPPTGACTHNCQGEVRAYSAGAGIDMNTAFEFKGAFYANKESLVKLGSSKSFAFRNPPAFLPSVFAQADDALREVEALLDHLFHHPNTPVFISHRLIQRVTASNPSPAYVQAVAEAFRSGTYNGKVYSGLYGDLSATTAAVLLHPEARSQSSPTNGALREPIVKLLHIMRSLEYRDRSGRTILMKSLIDLIGQWPFEAESVFNFYSAEFKPDAFPDGLVAPEFEIFTGPKAINWINGVTSLIDDGLGECRRGFGTYARNCSNGALHLGELECLQPSIDQLDLLLTGGRLGQSKEMMKAVYQEADGADRYKTLQKAVILTPEFHTLGASLPQGSQTRTAVPPPAASRDYKAMVMLFLNGGADTFNMLVPINCPLYEEYHQVRKNVALLAEQLHGISSADQPCAEFGIHPELSLLKELYDAGEAAFAANIGSLVEELDREQFLNGGAAQCANLFSHSDQQRSAQTLKCQSATASSRGAGGRMADALAGGPQGFNTMSFSVAGTKIWPQGFDTVAEVINERGVVGLEQQKSLETVIDNITSVKHGNIYCEEYNKQLSQTLQFNQELGKQIEKADLQTAYATENIDLSKQLQQVAKLIASRQGRGAERDFFFVEIGGFDTHRSVARELSRKFQHVNKALATFVNELKAQQIFESTVLITHSDFGRTLTPNSGAGTDHAWAGNHIIIGGGINGGKIFNEFPSSLLGGSQQDAGRGRIIPQYPWESVMMPIGQWMGLDASQYSEVFPNIANFNMSKHIIGRNQLFK